MILHLKKGQSEDTPFILIQFANIFLIKFKMYRFAAKLSSAAMKLLEASANNKYKNQTEFIYAIFISRWVNPEALVIDQLNKSIDKCKKSNQITFAIYSITQSIFTIIGSGEKLSNVEKFIYKHNPFIYSVGFFDTILTLEISKCFINSLKNGNDVYQTSIFDEKKALRKCKAKA